MTVNVTPKEEASRNRRSRRTTHTVSTAPPSPEHLARRRAEHVQAVKDAISGLELPLSVLAAAEQRRIGPDEVGAFTLDIVAIEIHKEPLANAVCDLAESYPVLGVVLDRLAKATPFGALFAVVVSLGAQLAENHRALPVHLRGVAPNLISRDVLVDQLRTEAEAQAAKVNGDGDRNP